MPKPFFFSLAAAAALATIPLSAEELPAVPATEATDIDYAGFEALTTEVSGIRAKRLITLQTFDAKAHEKGTLILDTRSTDAFARGHIAGAVNLPFSDFTDAKLAEVIGDNPGRQILIYCNNNFSDNMPPIPLKKAPLALNIPTFINLVGYGYTNVWELGDTVSITEVDWVGTEAALQLERIAKRKAALPN